MRLEICLSLCIVYVEKFYQIGLRFVALSIGSSRNHLDGGDGQQSSASNDRNHDTCRFTQAQSCKHVWKIKWAQLKFLGG